jgi:hypothetical protein
VTDEDVKDRRSFQGVDLGCKWEVIAEELDLHPVSLGATFLWVVVLVSNMLRIQLMISLTVM